MIAIARVTPWRRQPLGGLGFDWGALTNVVKTGTDSFSKIYQTVQPVPAGCTLVTGPNGQSYVSCAQPGQPTPVPYQSFGYDGASGFGGMGMLLLLGGGLLVLAMAKGGRA